MTPVRVGGRRPLPRLAALVDAVRDGRFRLRVWQVLHRCDCTYGVIVPTFEEDNVACRLGYHPKGCLGGHVGARQCPKHPSLHARRPCERCGGTDCDWANGRSKQHSESPARAARSPK